jgi:hypothetical protein
MILPLTLVVAQNTTGVASSCKGADPAIVSAKVVSSMPRGDMNEIHVAVTVVNNGSMRQASNVLQSVNVYQNATKVGQKGVPPLKPGQAYTFPYVFDRAVDAGTGTTHLRFALTLTQPSPAGSEDCGRDNDTYSIAV